MVAATFAVTNGRIFTGDPAKPWAEALASSGETILAVGASGQVDRVLASTTEVVDARGRLVLPGFIDAHVHLVWGYEVGEWVELGDCRGRAEILRRVADRAAARPGEEIVVGYGFNYAALPLEVAPKVALDGAVSDRPVLLLTYDGHTGWGNTRFTERALGVGAATPGGDLGEVQRDPRTGEATGLFNRVFDLLAILPELRRRRSVDGLARTVSMATRCGVTTAFDVQVELDDVHAYADLRKAGGLSVRIRAAIHHPRGTPAASYARFAEAATRFRDDWYRIGAVKLYIDGVQETGSAALLEPYANAPTSLGETVYRDAEYGGIVEDISRRGFQVLTHACGDRGARIALDAYARLGRAETASRRHRIEHCEVVDRADIPRFARLGVLPCMMPYHAAPGLTSRWQEAMGPARSNAAFPWRELLDSGASLGFASDWPVAPISPILGIHQAVSRTATDGGASPHRLSVPEAVRCYTMGAAYACHAETTRGSLQVGKYADLVILSENLFELPVGRIPETEVELTAVGGAVVYSIGKGAAARRLSH